ncbi:SDR family NAD(P)-dependent oxidoreductase [Salipiger mucosus]|uniref:SDR family NAD(P)-dependent oxidoreductase n=1 Tax=Salipiger mucosus TaxID=263378 RepID=UPI000A064674|nr:SDR family oxidoreductase [Salipiger mucosus]
MAKVAVVTGGTRGIGRAIAEDLSRDHQVAITWNTTPPEGLSDEMIDVQADLGRPGTPQRVIDEVIRRFGRLDVIVNNAGIIRQSPKEHFAIDEASEILSVNLLAPSALLSAALPHLGEGAAIVNIWKV